MLTWLLLGTVLYLITAYLPSVFLISGIGLTGYFGSRDKEPVQGAIHGRAQRAQRNFQENYPVFMALGILALVLPATDLQMAVTGAMIFVLARALYLPLYLFAVPLVRSVVFTIGLVGMVMMGVALI